MSSAEGFLTIHHTCVTMARNESQDISFLSGRALIPCQPVAPPQSHTYSPTHLPVLELHVMELYSVYSCTWLLLLCVVVLRSIALTM